MENFNDYLEEDLGLDQVSEEHNVEILEPEHSLFEDDLLGTPVDTPTQTILDEFLISKGITNSTITILDENENQSTVNFYELSKDEQLEVLNSLNTDVNQELDESEITLINHLRTNNLTVDDFFNQFKESILAEIQTQKEPEYDIDMYDDHELFLLDLKEKYELTDEELQAELEKELANPDLFTKKLTKLRAEYKQLEDQYKAQQQANMDLDRQRQYESFSNAMLEIANSVEDFHGVELEDSEKTETLSYLLKLDEDGVSQFSKDLNNPQKLYEAAWYLRYGAEAFKALENAYEEEIKKYKKADGPRVVVHNSKEKIKSIYDLN